MTADDEAKFSDRERDTEKEIKVPSSVMRAAEKVEMPRARDPEEFEDEIVRPLHGWQVGMMLIMSGVCPWCMGKMYRPEVETEVGGKTNLRWVCKDSCNV